MSWLLRLLLAVTLAPLVPAAAQNGREHPRLPERTPPGARHDLRMGTLYLPPKLSHRPPLLVFFHGGSLVPEVAAAENHLAVISIQAGSVSEQYSQAFTDPARLPNLIREAESKAHLHFSPLMLGGWSAGCGAVRQLLRTPAVYRRTATAVCIDGIHTDYVGDAAAPARPGLSTANLEIWVKFAQDSVAGRKTLLITHSEISPGTYAGTTESADYILGRLALVRRRVERRGPMGTQELSDTQAGHFRIIGFAGNSGPDHVDQLHSLPQFLKMLRPAQRRPKRSKGGTLHAAR